jgi:hypothetical protein
MGANIGTLEGLQYLFNSVLFFSLATHSLWDTPFLKGWNGHYTHDGLAIIPCTHVMALWGPILRYIMIKYRINYFLQDIVVSVKLIMFQLFGKGKYI